MTALCRRAAGRAAGGGFELNGSIGGLQLCLCNDLDDLRKPTTGSVFSFTQTFSGFGGNLKYISTGATFSHLQAVPGRRIIGSTERPLRLYHRL